MIRQLVVNNVLHRPIRTIVSVIAVGVEVALVILIVGLTSGLLQETAKRIEGIGADIMLQPPSASVFLAFSGAPMPIKIADKLRELRYVQAVAPVLLQFSSSGGVDIIYGIDPKSFRDVSGGFVFLEGHDMRGPDDILIDDWAAKAKNATVDSTFRLLDHDFHVAGIVEHGKGARLFVPLSTLQDLSGSRDKASIFFIKCTRTERGLASRRSAAALAKATERFGSAQAALHAKERAPALPAPSIALKRSTPHPGRSAGGDDAQAARGLRIASKFRQFIIIYQLYDG